MQYPSPWAYIVQTFNSQSFYQGLRNLMSMTVKLIYNLYIPNIFTRFLRQKNVYMWEIVTYRLSVDKYLFFIQVLLFLYANLNILFSKAQNSALKWCKSPIMINKITLKVIVKSKPNQDLMKVPKDFKATNGYTCSKDFEGQYNLHSNVPSLPDYVDRFGTCFSGQTNRQT